ncbi:uncharacterized protein Tco025E_08590 [Trypanosoma conorhini]|uniref:Uncharacterized protein n=1 Tax=Trypanosoma conorhini TaxID=83891 RepID=A0A3R7K7P9_9TRYP|nr:uncharacterized protein Tco025E_08590 [Trypanosoma conorhini]RNF01347.1 hypothetical protein Tco025E_08590 [Trypanosoma conorhini]
MGRTEVTKANKKSDGTPRRRRPHALASSQQDTRRGPTNTTAAEAPKPDEAAAIATPPRDAAVKLPEDDQAAAEETVTLSSASTPLSHNLSGPSPPSSFAPDYGTVPTAAPEAETRAAGPVTAQTEESNVRNAAPDALDDKLRSEQVLYYLEAARSLRQVTSGVEAQERFVRKELQRQSVLHDTKKAELAERQKVLERLQESTLRLTRQLRGLDSEGDHIRDRLTQLQAAIEKAGSRRAPRHVQREVNPVVRRNSTPPQLRVRGGSGGGAAIAPVRKSVFSARDALTAELEAYRVKLRAAETQHEELLKEIQLAVAKRKGRAAAYSSSGASWNFSGYPGTGSRESSFFTDSMEEFSAIQQLEQLIEDSLVRGL